MQWTRIAPRAAVGFASLAGIVAIACRDSAAPVQQTSSHDHGLPRAAVVTDVNEQLGRLKRLTSGFRNFEVAKREGYDIKVTDCMTDPVLGGMGFHYGNGKLIDGTPDPKNPEVLLYAPVKGGGLKLVGVEFIIPYTAWASTTPPSLFGRDFKKNDTFQVWALHVWQWQANPAGMFADWNPTVGCN
jgi:hypothetical protein